MYKLILSSLMSLIVFAEIDHSKRANVDELYNEKPKKKEVYRNQVVIGYQVSSTEISHNESSSTSGFYTLNDSSSVSEHILDLRIGRELFKEYLFSLSIYAQLGRVLASDSRDIDFQYTVKDSLGGYRYGGGASLNLNFDRKDSRFQFYIGGFYSQYDKTYKVQYEDYENSLDAIYIESELSGTQVQLGLGLRWFNMKNDVFSDFSIMSMTETTNESTSTGDIDGDSLNLTNSSTIKSGSITLGLGFGILF